MTIYTMDDIEWREGELADTVEFLNAVNPHGQTAERIKAQAFRSWEDGGYTPTFIGTAGWYVTIIPIENSQKPFLALVSVMAYTARKSLEERL
ncbi:hypothetical protein H7H48_15780 [Nitratireductor sp. B36]|uniref:hypothetical protein n=1 Tax=Nitratireductor sp. B36 TaxID=2762059 RepID=UPI001E3E36DE|nr:hypothetical protein [Nitratireductor sp. B36]MCC5780521.1 hypothetical protein [Nitratireductor sp. B36]